MYLNMSNIDIINKKKEKKKKEKQKTIKDLFFMKSDKKKVKKQTRDKKTY